MGEGRRGWGRKAAPSVSRVRRRRGGEGPGSVRHMLQLPPPLHCVSCVVIVAVAGATFSGGRLGNLVWAPVAGWYQEFRR